MSRPKIGAELEKAHSHVARAGFLLVTMIVKRKLWRSYVEAASKHLSVAQEILRKLTDGTDPS